MECIYKDNCGYCEYHTKLWMSNGMSQGWIVDRLKDLCIRCEALGLVHKPFIESENMNENIFVDYGDTTLVVKKGQFLVMTDGGYVAYYGEDLEDDIKALEEFCEKVRARWI